MTEPHGRNGYPTCRAEVQQQAPEKAESVADVRPVAEQSFPQALTRGQVRWLRIRVRNQLDPVRAILGATAVKVMMVTTETEMERMVMALDAGANEYVMKPFTAEVISDKLRLLGAL